MLFSQEFLVNDELDSKSKFLITELYNMRNDIAKMNLSYLYDACIGMYHSKMKYLEKGTEGNRYLVEKYKFDTKQGMHSIRILNFLERFTDNNFTDFKGAIWYQDNDSFKEYLLNIKNGAFDLKSFKEIATTTLQNIEKKYKPIYKEQKLDKGTNDRVLEMIKELVRINLN